jgi:hypothetical protein
MVGPGDERAAGAGRYSKIRASHADREQLIDLLKAAFVQDRLAKDEFDLLVGKVLASRTYGDLNVLSAGIPAGPTRPQPTDPAPDPDNQPAWESGAERKIVRAFACLLVAVPTTAFAIGLMESQSRPELGVADRVFLTIVLACILAVPAIGFVLFHSWIEKRSSSEPSPAPPPNAGARHLSA